MNVVAFVPQQPRSDLGFAAGRRKPATAVNSVIPPAMAAAGPADWPTPAPTAAQPKSAEPAPQTARPPAAVPPVPEPIPAVAGPAVGGPTPILMTARPLRFHAAAIPMLPAAVGSNQLPILCDASMVEGSHAECIPPIAAPVAIATPAQPALAAASAATLLPVVTAEIALFTSMPSADRIAMAMNPIVASEAPRMSGEQQSTSTAANSEPRLPQLSVQSTGAAELDRLAAPILNPAAHESFMPVAACEPAARWLTAAAANEKAPKELAPAILPAFAFQPVDFKEVRFAEAAWIRPVAALASPVDRPLWRGAAMPPVEQAMRIPTNVPAGAMEAAPPSADVVRCEPLLEIGSGKPVDGPAEIPAGVPSLRVPALPDLEKILPKGSVVAPAALPVESATAHNAGPEWLFAPPLAPQTQVAAAQTANLRPAPFQAPEARPAFPPPALWNPNVAVVEPMSPRLFRPVSLVWEENPALPEGHFIELEFYLQRGSGRPAEHASWITPVVTLCWPALTLKKVNEREQPTPIVHKEPLKEKEKVKVPEVPKRNPRAAFYLGRIAACLVAGVGLWLGAHLLRLSTVPSDAEVADATQADHSKPDVAVAGQPAQRSWLGRAIRNRAAVQVSDTFQTDMKSWGAGQGSWASGWTHSTDGYVRPGALALFQPTVNFTDYRLEFNGQIESKGMNWVVRAKDNSNYYGMKLSVVEPGLRPILAISHYTVVGGQKGRKVELPLSVMVHRSAPIQVAVDVKGRRVTTSIDGQEVDSWTDNTLARGGVGFFSEAGERARLYWTKVSKNQDWLGNICSYLSGGSGQTAEVRGPGFPGIPQPAAPPRGEDVAVVPESLQYRRYGRWNS